MQHFNVQYVPGTGFNMGNEVVKSLEEVVAKKQLTKPVASYYRNLFLEFQRKYKDYVYK